jgi:hypothetical protein
MTQMRRHVYVHPNPKQKLRGFNRMRMHTYLCGWIGADTKVGGDPREVFSDDACSLQRHGQRNGLDDTEPQKEQTVTALGPTAMRCAVADGDVVEIGIRECGKHPKNKDHNRARNYRITERQKKTPRARANNR